MESNVKYIIVNVEIITYGVQIKKSNYFYEHWLFSLPSHCWFILYINGLCVSIL